LNRVLIERLCQLAALIAGFTGTVTSQADALSAVQVLREGGCGGTLPAAMPLHHNEQLDRAAQQWAAGSTFIAATQHSGYQAQSSAALHISGAESATIALLRRADCRALADRNLLDIGVFVRGPDTWLVLASAREAVVAPGIPWTLVPAAPAPQKRLSPAPPAALTPMLATRVLQLVNDVRARGTRCGERAFGPAAPVRLSDTLGTVAFGHAIDMAEHNYFEHEDLSGRSPADRVRAIGYKEKLVGENIAYGPKTVEEVVQGWLDSPGHCENIMDPRFAEMGIAFAPGQSERRGLYWVQLLVAPKV
jgi:uncharacterized protein YkwD